MPTFWRNALACLALAAGLLPMAAHARIEANLSLAPAVIPVGTPSRASIVVQNFDSTPGYGLSYAVTLPAEMRIHGGGALANSCGGNPVLAESGERVTVSLSGGILPAGDVLSPGACTLSFDLTAGRGGTFVAEVAAGAVSAQVGGATLFNGTRAQASLGVTTVPISISGEIPQRQAKGGQSILIRHRFTNANDIALSGMWFDIDMSSIGTQWRALGPVENGCGGSLTFTPRSSAGSDYDPTTVVGLRGGAIAAKSSCVISYQIAPSRKPTASYHESYNVSQGLPAGLLSTDQGITNAAENSISAQFRSGIYSAMTINGQSVATMDVVAREEAHVVVRLSSSNIQPVTGLAVPLQVPAGIEILSMASTCGSLASTAAGAAWTLDMPAAPPEPSSWATADCTATLRVRARTGGAHVISLPAGNHPVQHAGGSAVTINANNSALGVAGEFDRASLKAPDSSIFRLDLVNKSSTDAVEGVTISNPVQARMPGTVIGPRGVVENTCPGGSAAIAPGRTGISFSGIRLEPGASCVLSYQVTFGSGTMNTAYSTTQARTNTIGPDDIVYRIGDAAPAAWNATLSDGMSITSSLNYTGGITPGTAAPGSRARLFVKMVRTNTEGHGLRDIRVNLPLAGGIAIDGDPGFRSTCGGILLAQPGSSAFQAEGGQLPFVPGQLSGECVFSVNVRLPMLAANESTRSIYISLPPNWANSRTHFAAQDQNVDGPAGYVASHAGSGITVNVGRYNLGLGVEFADAAVTASGTTRVIASISNAGNASLNLTDVGLSIDLSGTGLDVASVPDPRFRVGSGSSSACTGAVFTRLPKGYQLSAARIAGGAVCQFEFAVSASQGGNHIVSIPAGAITSAQGASNSSAAYATLTAGYLMSMSIGFDPNLSGQNELTSFIVEIINSLPDGGSNDYHGSPTALSFPLPAWLAPAGPAATTCEGAAASLSGRTLVLSGGRFAASSSCRLTLPVQVAAFGSYAANMPAGALQTVEGVSNPHALTASLRVLRPLSITIAAPPAMTGTGRIGRATLRIQNPNSSALNPEGMTGISLDVIPSGPLAFLPGLTSSACSGFAATPGTGNRMEIRGIILNAGASCTVSLAASSAVAGLHDAVTADVLSREAAFPSLAGTASSWRMVNDPVLRMFALDPPRSGTPFRMALEMENGNDVPIDLLANALTIALPQAPRSMKVHGAAARATGCGGASVAAPSGGSAVSLSGGALPARGTCRIEFDALVMEKGDYLVQVDALRLQYGDLFPDPVTITIDEAPATLMVSRSILVLAEDLPDPVLCAGFDAARASGRHALPGSCLKVSITIENPHPGEMARDIVARETIGTGLSLAGFEKGSFDAVTQAGGQLEATAAFLAPGEARSFTYRSVVN